MKNEFLIPMELPSDFTELRELIAMLKAMDSSSDKFCTEEELRAVSPVYFESNRSRLLRRRCCEGTKDGMKIVYQPVVNVAIKQGRHLIKKHNTSQIIKITTLIASVISAIVGITRFT